MLEIKQEIFNFWSIVLQILTAGGLIYFAWRQTQINKRMQELADYVAVFMIPMANFSLQIKNVGRSNLYLHKWEIGSLTETYVKPRILPTGEGPQILIQISSQAGQHLAKFYFTDEKDIKYLSTGEVVIEPVGFQLPPPTTPPQSQQQDLLQGQTSGIQPINISVQMRMRAWAYKTEKYNWTI